MEFVCKIVFVLVIVPNVLLKSVDDDQDLCYPTSITIDPSSGWTPSKTLEIVVVPTPQIIIARDRQCPTGQRRDQFGNCRTRVSSHLSIP
ncbi:uncharacterized protein LOC144472024 isoform X2 [Augochlora pura]